MKKFGLLFLYALLIYSALRASSQGTITNPLVIIAIALAIAGLLLGRRLWRLRQNR